MKKMMNMILPMIALFFLQASAQNDKYLDGHVVTTSGEIIEGEIKKLSDERSAYKIVMFTDNGEQLKFEPENVESYVRGDQSFEVKSYLSSNGVTAQPRFMEVLSDGDLKLLEYNYVDKHLMRQKDAKNPSKASRPHFYAETYDYFLEKDGQHTLVSKSDFTKSILPYVEENSELVMELLKGMYTYDDLEEIVAIYNYGGDSNYTMHELESLKSDEAAKSKN